MTMTGNDRFAILVLHCTIQRIFCLFAIKFSCNLDRTYCITATYNFSAQKVGVKACIQSENVVSLHRQSKEQPFVPRSGLLLRPTRVINDGRRRSSMKTPKTAGTGRSGELQNMDSKHTTNNYD